MPEKKFYLDRFTSAFAVGLIFVLFVTPIFYIDSGITWATGTLIGTSSPIYIWRYYGCYHDPVWLLNIESIVPFFLYGIVWGYFLNMSPRFNCRYLGAIAKRLCITFALLTITLYFHPDFSPC